MYLTIVWLAFSSLALAEPKGSQCKHSQVTVVSNMAPNRSQGPVGFCYAFGAIQLLDQFRCKNKNGGCKFGLWTPPQNGSGMSISMPDSTSDSAIETQKVNEKTFGNAFGLGAISPENFNINIAQLPDDRLSVLDAIAISKNGALVEGGHANLVLESIQKQGSLALEKCVPYDGILTSDTKRIQENIMSNAGLDADSIEAISWRERLGNLFEELQTLKQSLPRIGGQFKSLNSCPKVAAIAERMKETANLSSSIEQIIESFHNSEFTEFLKQAIIPKSCEADRVEIEPFSVSNARPSTEAEIKSTIQSVLSTDTPVAIAICANTLEKLRQVSKKACAPHAVVISGQRTECCQDICKTQYQVVDSAMMFWAESNLEIDPYDAWLDADEISERILHKTRIFKSIENPKPTLTWMTKK